MAKKHRLPLDTYAVISHPYSGVGPIYIAEGLTLEQARLRLVSRADRFERLGYPVWRENADKIEIQTPENALLISDYEGIIEIERETCPAYECFECGTVLPVDTPCDCLEPFDENALDTED